MKSWDLVPEWPELLHTDPLPHYYNYPAITRWWTKIGSEIFRFEIVGERGDIERLYLEKWDRRKGLLPALEGPFADGTDCWSHGAWWDTVLCEVLSWETRERIVKHLPAVLVELVL